MNKTINELVALTELANEDELIVYDVSEGTSKKIKKSDFVTTNIESGNLKPPTSNAVAFMNDLSIKKYWNNDPNVNTDVLEIADTMTIGKVSNFRIGGSYVKNSPYGASATDCDFFYTCQRIDEPNYIRLIGFDIRTNYIYENAKVGGTWQGWQKLTDSTVNNIPVTIDTSHITTPASNAWVNCYKNGKVVTVTVEVANGSANLTANTINRIAYGFPIPVNGVVNGYLTIDNFSIYKRMWVSNDGSLNIWVGDNCTGNLFASVTYIEA